MYYENCAVCNSDADNNQKYTTPIDELMIDDTQARSYGKPHQPN